MKRLPKLHQDIIANILSRLPVKFLMQLKCVCKPWQSLISDPQFAKLHLEQALKNSSYRVLLLTEPLESAACEASAEDLDDESKLISEIEYPVAMKKTPDSDELVDGLLEIGGSCNGLICAVFEHERIFLWNPTTREAKEFAKLNAFDDPKGEFSYGLGYDFSTDDYKIVRAAHPSAANASKETEIEVLALKSNIWRRVQGLPSGTEIQGAGPGIFIHGALHWLATIETGVKKISVVVAFSMVEEKFYELVQVPDHIEARNNTTVLGISGDCLCLFYGCGYETVLEAWLLKEYGIKSSWSKLFSVERDILHGHKYWENALCYTKTGKVVTDYDGRDLVWYDPKDQTSKTFTPRNEWDWFGPALYIETLVSPNCYSATNV